jgi:hypothetical protein
MDELSVMMDAFRGENTGSQSSILIKKGGKATGAELFDDTRMLEEGNNDTPGAEETSDKTALPLTTLRPASRNTNWTSEIRAYVLLEYAF